MQNQPFQPPGLLAGRVPAHCGAHGLKRKRVRAERPAYLSGSGDGTRLSPFLPVGQTFRGPAAVRRSPPLSANGMRARAGSASGLWPRSAALYRRWPATRNTCFSHRAEPFAQGVQRSRPAANHGDLLAVSGECVPLFWRWRVFFLTVSFCFNINGLDSIYQNVILFAPQTKVGHRYRPLRNSSAISIGFNTRGVSRDISPPIARRFPVARMQIFRLQYLIVKYCLVINLIDNPPFGRQNYRVAPPRQARHNATSVPITSQYLFYFKSPMD